MMMARGHTVYHYGHERSDVYCTKHLSVTDDDVLTKAYGADYDFRKTFFRHSGDDHAHVTFCKNAIEAIKIHKQPNDFLLMFWGLGHKPVMDAHPDLIAVEPGIGCYNRPSCSFNVFESYAVMHGIYAKHNMQPGWFDCVIPNYFEPDPVVEDSEDELLEVIRGIEPGFALVICRMCEDKGVGLAVDAASRAGFPVVLAGQGDPKHLTDKPFHFLGYVQPKHRRALLAKARCLMSLSYYTEPFGGIAVEAQFAGVPVITTDWGAYPETVLHGVTGFRCRTMDHIVFALKNCTKLDRKAIQTWASSRYGFDKVASMYEEYFGMLVSVRENRGFYDITDRDNLDWLRCESLRIENAATNEGGDLDGEGVGPGPHP
jgi:glycosyltransferase involved in cell wall biosynthesis